MFAFPYFAERAKSGRTKSHYEKYARHSQHILYSLQIVALDSNL